MPGVSKPCLFLWWGEFRFSFAFLCLLGGLHQCATPLPDLSLTRHHLIKFIYPLSLRRVFRIFPKFLHPPCGWDARVHQCQEQEHPHTTLPRPQDNESQQCCKKLQQAGSAGIIHHLERKVLLGLEWRRRFETLKSRILSDLSTIIHHICILMILSL